MASTYSPQDAVNLAQTFAHGISVSSIQAFCCDQINSIMWAFYPWSWSIATLTPIAWVNLQQDYTVTDTNVLRPLTLRVRRTDVSPQEVRELALLANLPVELSRTAGIETMQNCGWLASSSTIRLAYAASLGTGQAVQIEGFFQKTPTKITASNLSTPFAFPDHYFNVFVEGLKWQFYTFADDQRAGAGTYSKNGTMQRNYSGYYAVFMNSLLEMARTEDLSAGDEFSFPEQPLGVGRSYFPGLYGI